MKTGQEFLEIKSTGIGLSAGRILISVPLFNDPFFNRSVIFLADYEKDGACVGLMLNKKSKYSVNEITSDIKVDDPMYIGGPVLPDGIFCLHNFQNSKECTKIIPGIYIGFDQVFLALVESHAINNMKYKFFVGYSGWAPGQLEEEINNKMWILTVATPELVFDTTPDKIWEKAVRNLGPDFYHWLKMPVHINHN